MNNQHEAIQRQRDDANRCSNEMECIWLPSRCRRWFWPALRWWWCVIYSMYNNYLLPLLLPSNSAPPKHSPSRHSSRVLSFATPPLISRHRLLSNGRQPALFTWCVSLAHQRDDSLKIVRICRGNRSAWLFELTAPAKYWFLNLCWVFSDVDWMRNILAFEFFGYVQDRRPLMTRIRAFAFAALFVIWFTWTLMKDLKLLKHVEDWRVLVFL